MRSMALGIVALVTLVSAARAEENRITLSGNITDSMGALVSGAELNIHVKNCKCSDCKDEGQCNCCPNQLTVQSDGGGQYSFSVPHGTYAIDVKAGRFEAHVEVDLNEGSEKTQDIRVSTATVAPINKEGVLPDAVIRCREGTITRGRGFKRRDS